MVSSLVVKKLKSLYKPYIVLFSEGFRYEGVVLGIDEEFLELYDDVRNYRKFLKIKLIDSVEVKE